jgi:Domain of unknown function (DUF4124)
MQKRLFLSLLLLCACSASAQVYKWVDEDGVVHYSDQPVPGAERIDLPSRPSTPPAASTRPAPARPAAAARSTPASRQPAAPFSYTSLSVASPAAEQTLWNIGGQLTVNLSLQPGLRSGDRVRLYFDGTPTETQLGLSFQLQEVWRGEHNLQAEVIDANGQLMIRSEPIRFYVQQTSVLNP